jgi:hypothetical protein
MFTPVLVSGRKSGVPSGTHENYLTAEIAKNSKRENKNDRNSDREIRRIRENRGDGEISHEDAKTRREHRTVGRVT